MPQHCACIRSCPDGLQGNFTIVLDDMHIFFKFKIQNFIKKQIMEKFSGFFSLHEDEDDKGKTLESVKKNIDFKGANLWILACAIIIASVGLNVNSTAVIIGASQEPPARPPIAPAMVLPRGPRLNCWSILPRPLPPAAPATSWMIRLMMTAVFMMPPLPLWALCNVRTTARQ